MLDNKLCLISVVEFLHRSCVDRDTRKGKVVDGTDLSKGKVHVSDIDVGSIFIGSTASITALHHHLLPRSYPDF